MSKENLVLSSIYIQISFKRHFSLHFSVCYPVENVNFNLQQLYISVSQRIECGDCNQKTGKVLLRDRKRHTAHCVACLGGGGKEKVGRGRAGYPCPVLSRGTLPLPPLPPSFPSLLTDTCENMIFCHTLYTSGNKHHQHIYASIFLVRQKYHGSIASLPL